jgi:hypothetical protein
MLELKFLVLRNELKTPVIAYEVSYADSTSSEKIVKDRCIEIAKILSKKEIKFAIFDGDFYMNVMIDQSDFEKVREIAEESDITVWSFYLEKQTEPEPA